MTQPRKKSRWISVMLFFVYLAILEGGTRFFFGDTLRKAEEPPAGSSENASNLTGNPYLLWELESGTRTMDGVPAQINSYGMRGPELEVPKPGGVRRILMTGDSSNFGFRVKDNEVMLEVAANLLGGTKSRIEAVNASVPGYSSYQSINLLEMRGWRLEPDVLVIGNLSSDNNFDAFVDKELLATYRRMEEGLFASFHETLKISALYRVLDYYTRVTKGMDAARKVGWGLGTGEQIGKRRVEVNDYAKNLDYLVEAAQSRDMEVVLLLPAVTRDMDPSFREPAAWELYRTVMRDTALRYGVPILEIPDLFKASGHNAEDLFLDEMHPSVLGHQIIGEALARTLTLWAKGRPLVKDGTGKERPVYVDRFLFTEDSTETPSDAPDPTVAVESQEWHRIRGRVLLTSYKGKALQVDARQLTTPDQEVVATANLSVPGVFDMKIPTTSKKIGFLVYEDLEGDGPTARDRRFDLMSQVVPVSGELSEIVIDLDSQVVNVPK